MREHYRIPTIKEISSQLENKRVFSTLDLKDGYWQIELDDESSLLCTFATPFGRYRFTRMPFGLSSASEVFQKNNESVFEGIKGIHIVSDDIIIAGSSLQEHDQILRQVLERAKERNVRFNYDKLQLRVPEVKYLGTIITADGMKPDPSKVKAINDIPTPTDKADVRRLLGMINFLACHIPDMSTTTAPLRDLLKSDVHFHWNTQQEEALSKIKQILSTAPVLKYFDPSKASTIQADASKHGLGACLLQQGKPVAYASRSLTPLLCFVVHLRLQIPTGLIVPPPYAVSFIFVDFSCGVLSNWLNTWVGITLASAPVFSLKVTLPHSVLTVDSHADCFSNPSILSGSMYNVVEQSSELSLEQSDPDSDCSTASTFLGGLCLCL